MSSLEQTINHDLRQAMKDKEELKLSTLRMLLAGLKNKIISLRQGAAVEITDELVQETLVSEIKKRKDSAEAYTAGNRPELAAKEQAEIELLKKYLPPEASDEEIEAVVKEIVAAGSADLPARLADASSKRAGEAGFGKTMGQAMARLKGRADGKRVGEIVKRTIGE